MITVSWKPKISASSSTASHRYYPVQADQADWLSIGFWVGA